MKLLNKACGGQSPARAFYSSADAFFYFLAGRARPGPQLIKRMEGLGMHGSRHSTKAAVWLILSWGLVAACMAAIFCFSQQSGVESQSLSDGLLSKIFDMIGLLIPSAVIRKLAHAAEFALLAVLLFHALYRTCGRGRPWLAWSLSTLYAVTDEVHQIFIPGRACRFFDVCVDAAGALAGVLFCLLLLFLLRRLSAQKSP